MWTYERLGVEPVINAAGRLTALGGMALSDEVAASMAQAATAYVDLQTLKERAAEEAARLAGAEAAWITTGAAAGIAMMVGAVIAGEELSRVERLPEVDTGPRGVLIQRGHVVTFGAPIEQMIRLGGGRPLPYGWANDVHRAHLEGAVDENVAAIMHVVSHHAVQKGALGLEEVIAVGRAKRVPVLVDAAAEEDLQRYLQMGADAVAYSGGKALGGPTCGLILGRKDFIRACAAQERGIARTMKVGKETLVAFLTALEQYVDADGTDRRAQLQEIVDVLMAGLRDLPGTGVETRPDEAGRSFARVAVHPRQETIGFSARDLATDLREGRPAIYTRAHFLNLGYLLIDPRPLSLEEAKTVVERVWDIYRTRQAVS